MTDQNEALRRRGLAFLRSKKALIHNAKVTMAYAGAKRLIAVIKANGYGHGDVWVARTLYDNLHVHDFAVATLAEGERVRQAMPEEEVQIVLLGVQPAEFAPEMVAQRLAPVAGSLDWLLRAVAALTQSDTNGVLSVHLAVDTGMGRLGAKSQEELAAMVDFVRTCPKLSLAGVMTHFATADEDNPGYYCQQLADFMKMVTGLGIEKDKWHLANSGSALFHRDDVPTDNIRVGSVLYGYNPAMQDRALPVELKPVASLVGRLWGVHLLKKGESLSYGATYTAKKDQWVGTIPIGYADGLKRVLSGMSVLVNGKREKILGRITMDQIVISLSERVPINTQVTFIGRDGEEEITIEEMADFGHTIPHELLTGFSDRIPRVDVAE
ncbi:alanine racemase [Fructobacillus fructosus]|uniref:Alanine racemase n=1 Tax=Fructobacillus fructosus TaxID=1631 RepID=A0ABN9YW45_9LACO|nr:alanine racemase [Fructobacillus fructosus]MBD9366355.1 alanine racemase [Leuconostoc mesenteroides]KRN52304.1 alanine racemase [Fructobacillus fructosus KCTC 3544]MBC9119158.1 alanine racemase [Fructobacillus fructosus]MCK8638787.1 alanine racemase [Fructobacillus fructosus]CAK1246478.1 Alanine racemase (Alr) [Fructobacillus fructosus]